MVKDRIKLLTVSFLCAFVLFPLCVFGDELYLERTRVYDNQVTNDIGTTGHLMIDSLTTDAIQEPELKKSLSGFLEEHIDDCRISNRNHSGEEYLFYDTNSISIPYIGAKCISIIDRTVNYGSEEVAVNHFCFNWDREKKKQLSIQDVFVSSDELVDAIFAEGDLMYETDVFDELSDEEKEIFYQIFSNTIMDHLVVEERGEICWFFTPEGVTIGMGDIEDNINSPSYVMLPYDRYPSIYNEEYIIPQDDYILEIDGAFLIDVDHDNVKEMIKISFGREFESGDPYVCKIEKEEDREYAYVLRGISYYPIEGRFFNRIYLVHVGGEQFVYIIVRDSYGGEFPLNVIKFNENGIPIYIGKDVYNYGAMTGDESTTITDIINTDPQKVICSIQDTLGETKKVECYIDSDGFLKPKVNSIFE